MKTELSNDILTAVQQFSTLFNSIDSDYAAIRTALSDANQEQEDLLHEIELSPFNSYEGYLLAKKLRDVRLCRRQLDNDLKISQLIIDFVKKHPDLGIALFKLARDTSASMNGLATRTYTPRIRKDIKLYKVVG